ncbi:unnamed protein product [Camellia sinensis]
MELPARKCISYWLKHEEVVAIENELSTRKNVVDNVKVALESLPYADRQMAILQKGSTESRLKGLVAELVKLKDSLTTTALEVVASRGKVGKGNAEVALSWVAYDEELKDGLWSTSIPVSRNLTRRAHKRGFTKCIHHSF